jgi:hypothetical protein
MVDRVILDMTTGAKATGNAEENADKRVVGTMCGSVY